MSGIGAGSCACPGRCRCMPPSTRAQAGCFTPKLGEYHPRTGSVSPLWSDQDDPTGKKSMALRAQGPSDQVSSAFCPTIRASMSGPRWNAQPERVPSHCFETVDNLQLPKSTRQTDRSAVTQRRLERSVAIVFRGPCGDLPLWGASATRSTCSGPDATRGRGPRRWTDPVRLLRRCCGPGSTENRFASGVHRGSSTCPDRPARPPR